MNDEMFLLDNNVLSHLTLAQRGSSFFNISCRLPTEVLFEALGYPDIEVLRKVEYPTTVGVLAMLAKVMSSLPVRDIGLVDLYANKGAGDPMLIACALEGQLISESQLIGYQWVVVSNDKAVRQRAVELFVKVMTRDEFMLKTAGRWGC